MIRKIACIGTGVIGHSWATLFAMRGYTVNLQDINENSLEKASHWIEQALILCAEKNVIAKKDITTALKRVTTVKTISEAVAEADFAVESTLESYKVKKEVFKEMDATAQKDVILASSSSGLLMTEIQKATKKPERCIVAHPYNPPHLVPLVELVPGEATSKTTVNRTYEFMESLGKIPVVLRKEVASYVGSKVIIGMFQEVDQLVRNGVVTAGEIDKILSTGPGIRWALPSYGPYMHRYFNSVSHLGASRGIAERVPEGYEKYSLLEGKSYDEMVRWRDSMLIDLLRVLGYLTKN